MSFVAHLPVMTPVSGLTGTLLMILISTLPAPSSLLNCLSGAAEIQKAVACFLSTFCTASAVAAFAELQGIAVACTRCETDSGASISGNIGLGTATPARL